MPMKFGTGSTEEAARQEARQKLEAVPRKPGVTLGLIKVSIVQEGDKKTPWKAKAESNLVFPENWPPTGPAPDISVFTNS